MTSWPQKSTVGLTKWADEFRNRDVLEEMLERFGFVGHDGSPELIASQDWPWPDDDSEPWREDSSSDGWIDRFRQDGNLSAMNSTSATGLIGGYALPLESRQSTASESFAPPVSTRQLTDEEQALLKELRSLAEEPADLQAALPTGSVLIRAFLDAENDAVRWMAWHNDGTLNQVVRQTGSSGAGRRLHLVNFAFDALVEAAWAFQRDASGTQRLSNAQARDLRRLGRMVLKPDAEPADMAMLEDEGRLRDLIENAVEGLSQLVQPAEDCNPNHPGHFGLGMFAEFGRFLLQHLVQRKRLCGYSSGNSGGVEPRS
ncbi:MAG: hypothetical protein R3C19_10115 [Planctomycetaceae bacterium]